MEEAEKPYRILDSKTIRWIIGVAVAAACRMAVLTFGLPDFVPPDVQNEAILMCIGALELAGAGMLWLAAWFRVKATKIIEGWRS